MKTIFTKTTVQESMNGCMKKEIDHQKKSGSPGKSSKCSYAEFSDISENFVGKYCRNVYRAIVGDSPYKLAPSYSHLEVSKEEWAKLSKVERVARIAVIDDCGAKEYENEPSSPTPSASKFFPTLNAVGYQKPWRHGQKQIKFHRRMA